MLLLLSGCLSSSHSNVSSAVNNESNQTSDILSIFSGNPPPISITPTICSSIFAHPNYLYRVEDPTNLSSVNESAIPMEMDNNLINKSEFIAIALNDSRVMGSLESGGEIMYIGPYGHPESKSGSFKNYFGLFIFYPTGNCGGGNQIIFGVDPETNKVVEEEISPYQN